MSTQSTSSGSLAVVGLGPMGTAIASALCRLDPDLSVWNRSPGRMTPLVERGMTAAGSVEEAIGSAEISFLCVQDYDVSRELLERCPADLLAGRTVVQLSTGTPDEARALASWLRARQADYLDGSLLSYPSEIGTADSVVLCAGEPQVFDRARDALSAIGPNPVFCGASVGAAAAQGQGALLILYGASFGFLQGAAIAAAEGTPIDASARVGERVGAMIPSLLRGIGKNIQAAKTQNAEALSETDATALEQISATSTAAGISTRISDAMLSVMQDAVALDDKGESMAVAYQVIRCPTR